MCTGWMDLRGRGGAVIAAGSGLLAVLYEEAQPDLPLINGLRLILFKEHGKIDRLSQ